MVKPISRKGVSIKNDSTYFKTKKSGAVIKMPEPDVSEDTLLDQDSLQEIAGFLSAQTLLKNVHIDLAKFIATLPTSLSIEEREKLILQQFEQLKQAEMFL